MKSSYLFLAAMIGVTAALASTSPKALADDTPISISGRYPHLAMFNHQGECGTGAVVPWADRLWVITYAPHMPNGSDDKLYEIDADLKRVTRPESVGGTPADRMIHGESKQLIIGPYFIDAQRNVRVITPKQMPGRLTAVTRDLSDPANRVYFLDMEGMLYGVDVHSLAVTKLSNRVANGAHAKGAYTSQGRLVIGNNGNIIANNVKPTLDDPEYAKDPEAAGVLAEWDGKVWRTIERRQFTDVTGPGGINGAPDATSPLWTIGWDKRSVLLKLLEAGQWHTYRLPIADYSYVAKHGWYSEWPRIREVGPGQFLMNMHGGWFDFPKTFSAGNTAGIRPIGDYLKITGDFAPWKNQIVFGCDDASLLDNPLLGQSQSNLWFTRWDGLKKCGRPAGEGGPWVADAVNAGEPSTPYLLAGYTQRVAHLAQTSNEPVVFTLEIDLAGTGHWKTYASVTVPPHGYQCYVIPPDVAGEWIRVKTDRDCVATAFFNYGPGGGAETDRSIFASLPEAGTQGSWSGGVIRPLGADAGTLLFESKSVGAKGAVGDVRPLELGADLKFRPYAGYSMVDPKLKDTAKEYAVTIDAASVILTQGKNGYRLPIASNEPAGERMIREVVTERGILNAAGSFYMLPYPTAGGAARIKPISTHNKQIADFCSWRGMMVMSGAKLDAKPDGHYFATVNNGPGLWLGDIDDLWKLGKPVGHGGPWLKSRVEPNQPSDPYLMAGYDRKTLELSHDAAASVQITIEVDFTADGTWRMFKTIDVPAGQMVKFEFPYGYSSHWVRFKSATACFATAQLIYE